jgi:hypothetical protein
MLRLGILMLILALAVSSLSISRAKYVEVVGDTRTWYMSRGLFTFSATDTGDSGWNPVTPGRGWWAIFLRGGQGGRFEDSGDPLDNGPGGEAGYVYALCWFDGATTIYCKAGQGGGVSKNKWGATGGGTGSTSGDWAGGGNGGAYSIIAYNNSPANENDLLAVAAGGGGGGSRNINRRGGWGGIITEIPATNANTGTEDMGASPSGSKYYWTGNFTTNTGWGNQTAGAIIKGGGFIRRGSQGRDVDGDTIVTTNNDSYNGGGGGVSGGGERGTTGGTNGNPPTGGPGGFLKGGNAPTDHWGGGGGGGFWGGGAGYWSSGTNDGAGGGGSSYIKATNNGVRLRTLTNLGGTYAFAWNYIYQNFYTNTGNAWTAKGTTRTKSALHHGVVCLVFLSSGDYTNGNSSAAPGLAY